MSSIPPQAQQFVQDKLYLLSTMEPPLDSNSNVHYFTIDKTLVYASFYADFGPNNLGQIIRFCDILQEKFTNPVTRKKRICLYSSMDIDKRCNAAFLMCCYMMLVLRKSPEDSCAPLMNTMYPPYRDAGYGPATFHISILDCLRGLYKVLVIGLLDIQNLDVAQYEFYERVENGDFNWITNKFLALACPKEELPPGLLTDPTKKMTSCYAIDSLVKYMLDHNVKTIIRLNNKTYDRKKFLAAGIEHIELYFPDGTTPPDTILRKFIEICETRNGPIAVHCKAGLGRTGTLIACYLMKNYRLTACEVISFLRLARPGSVVGPQQNFLNDIQNRLWKLSPITPLPVEISMWKPPTFPMGVTRFGLPLGGLEYANTVNKGSAKEMMKESVQEKMDLTQLVIPIQPRKGLSPSTSKVSAIQNWRSSLPGPQVGRYQLSGEKSILFSKMREPAPNLVVTSAVQQQQIKDQN